jgi:hypothetical protein
MKQGPIASTVAFGLIKSPDPAISAIPAGPMILPILPMP